jgi:hypothetical protein
MESGWDDGGCTLATQGTLKNKGFATIKIILFFFFFLKKFYPKFSKSFFI